MSQAKQDDELQAAIHVSFKTKTLQRMEMVVQNVDVHADNLLEDALDHFGKMFREAYICRVWQKCSARTYKRSSIKGK